jgi:tetratricopeptide (TPR) repeat protein
MIAHAATRWILAVGYTADRVAEAMATAPLARSAAALVADQEDAQAELLSAIAAVRYRGGDHAEALRLWQQALGLQQRPGEAADSEVAVNHQNIGVAALNLCDYDTAVRELRFALEIQRRLLGPDHSKVGHILTNLSAALLATDNPAEALTSARDAFEILLRAHGPADPWLARTLYAMGQAEATLGNVAAGVASGLRAYAITEAALGPKHSEFGRAAQRLADLYATQDNHVEALRYYERAVAAYEPDHPGLAAALVGTATASAALGHLAVSEALLRRAVDQATAKELDSLPRAQTALARLLWRRGRSEQALSLAHTALGGFETSHHCQAAGDAAELRAWLERPR